MKTLTEGLGPFAGRLLIVYIYATSGIAKLLSWSGNVAYMETRHLPMVPVLLGIALIIEIVGSLCLIFGFWTRVAAFVMFLYTTVLTLLFHNYWAFSGMLRGTRKLISGRISRSWEGC